MDEDTLIDNP